MRTFIIIVLLAIMGCSKNRDAQATNKASDLTESLQVLMERQQLIGLSVALIKDHELAYAKGFGVANLGRQTPINEHTKFRIASISKLITSIALMQLVEQGMVDLDIDISQYLGWELVNPNVPQTHITLRNILSHQSGIRDGEDYGKYLQDMHRLRLNIKELFTATGAYYSPDMFASEPPKSNFSYCNSAWGLVASVIEKVAGMSFNEYCSKNIFKPMGLNASYRAIDIAENDLAALYRFQSNEWVPQVDDYRESPPANLMYEGYEPGTNGLIFAPQGGVRASVLDLAVIALMFMNEGQVGNTRILTPQSLNAMTTEQWTYNGVNGDTWNEFFQAYGLGVHLLTNKPAADIIYPEMKMLGHAGIAYGLLSDMYLDPEKGAAVILVTNGSKNTYEYSNSSAFYQVEQEVFDVCHLYLKDSILSPNYQ